MNYEGNIPTIYSSLLLIFAALISIKLFKKDHFFRNIWFLSSIIFLFLSIDEFFMIHERLNSFYLFLFNKSSLAELPKFFRFWFLFYIFFGGCLCLFYSKFWYSLYPKYRRLLLYPILIYSLGGLGGEILDFSLVKFFELDRTNIIHQTIYLIEEILEILGIILLTYNLLIILNLSSVNKIYLAKNKNIIYK